MPDEKINTVKISNVIAELAALAEKYGDIDLGNPVEISLYRNRVGWISGWSTRVVSNGLAWRNRSGEHFVGTEELRGRTGGDWLYEPTESELGKPHIREVNA